MELFTGVDIVEIQRITDSINKYGDVFLKRIYTAQEIEYCEARNVGKYQSYAARFAAKEALSKAIGTGISGDASLTEIEVVNDAMGAPKLFLHGAALRKANEMGVKEFKVSLSHSHNYAVAFVVGFKPDFDVL